MALVLSHHEICFGYSIFSLERTRFSENFNFSENADELIEEDEVLFQNRR